VFVSPDVILPRVIEQLRKDIDPDLINALSDSDLGIWSTPEGTPYINGIVMKQLGNNMDIDRITCSIVFQKERRGTEEGQGCRDSQMGG
jgi:hypothetical protein